MKIDKNYSLKFDENNTILVFKEMRKSEAKDAINGEKMFTEEYYYPNVASALKKFLDLSLESAEDVKHCLDKVDEAYGKIELLSKSFSAKNK